MSSKYRNYLRRAESSYVRVLRTSFLQMRLQLLVTLYGCILQLKVKATNVDKLLAANKPIIVVKAKHTGRMLLR